MRVVVALLVAVAVGCWTLAARRRDLSRFVGRYLQVRSDESSPDSKAPFDHAAIVWGVVGGFVGILLAQGDLFISGAARSVPALAILGAAGGVVAWSARRTTLAQRRAVRLRYELPLACDALALHVVAGESVSSALAQLVEATTGVASEELRDVLHESSTHGVAPALTAAAERASIPEARRLYELLAHAHGSGGRLADALLDLAADFRAGLERDLTTESGRRMVTTYGPVLALMVPTALLFLLYPTLLGLRTLSGAP